ncbi:MAG: winged helix-turn-helix domain-containing protein [Candidatus Bathyarchaeia archaeon]
MSLEEVFSSKGRVKILKILVEIGELNISEIARRSGLNYTTTNKHLQILEETGLVRHKNFGRIRIFRFNEGSRRARMIKDLVDNWTVDK